MGTTLLRMIVLTCLGIGLMGSSCFRSHNATQAYYDGGPEHPTPPVTHSETWHVVTEPDSVSHGWMSADDVVRFEHTDGFKLIWQGPATGGMPIEIDLVDDTDAGSDYDFVSASPVTINGHAHTLKVGRNVDSRFGVAGEIAFFAEDAGTSGTSHPGHAGANR